MQTPTLSKKQEKRSLTGSTKKKELIKNVVAKVYENYWPLANDSDCKIITDVLKDNLPHIVSEKPCIPYKTIKTIPKDERKKYRQSLIQNIIGKDNRKGLVFGINSVTKSLEKHELDGILLSHDIEPRFMVQHIADLCVLYSCPLIVIKYLRDILKECCGFSSTCIAIQKNNLQYIKITRTILTVSNNYEIPKNHINYHRQLSDSDNFIDITDSDDCIDRKTDSSSNIKQNEVSVNKYLYRTSLRQRVFVPEFRSDLDKVNLDSNKLPIPIPKMTDKQRAYYNYLIVKRIRGNKARNNNKMKKFKKTSE